MLNDFRKPKVILQIKLRFKEILYHTHTHTQIKENIFNNLKNF